MGGPWGEGGWGGGGGVRPASTRPDRSASRGGQSSSRGGFGLRFLQAALAVQTVIGATPGAARLVKKRVPSRPHCSQRRTSDAVTWWRPVSSHASGSSVVWTSLLAR